MLRALFRVFDYSGRSTRWEYWSFFIGLVVLSFFGGMGLGAYRQANDGLVPPLTDEASAVTAIAVVFVLILPLLALKVRRYHDFGWSGWAVLWVFVPLVNLFMELMLLFRGPVEEAAVYEPQPITIYNTPSAVAPGAGSPHASTAEQIRHLADLHAQGSLTAREFAAAKAKVLRQ